MPVSDVPQMGFAGHTSQHSAWARMTGDTVGVGRRTAWPSGRRLRMTLNQIEKALVAEDPGLGSVFTIFTRLTCREAMPGTEQALPRQWMARSRRSRTRPKRLMVRKFLFTAGLIVCLGAPVAIGLAFGSHTCGTASGLRQSTIKTESCQTTRDRP